jgi:membrane protein YqaA with SNARE-associated domain
MLRRLYDWTMAKAADPLAERWLAVFSFIEASFFPIPPHPVLGLMCLAEPRRAIRFAAVATLASVAGGLLGYAIGALLYDSVGKPLLAALGLTEGVAEARCLLANAPLIVVGLFAAKAVTPIPFKLLTITAGFLQFPLLWFVVASLVSRGISFMIVGVLFRLFGAPIKAFIDRYLGWVTAAFVVLVVGGFVAAAMLGGEAETSAAPCRPAAVSA